MADAFLKLTVGMAVERQHSFTDAQVTAFGEVVSDRAPVHFETDFATSRGFAGRLVHGLLVGGMFSGLLGEQLPGPHSVINQLSLKYHRPVLIGDCLLYRVNVTALTASVRAVTLRLEALTEDGSAIVTGTAICSFPQSGQA